MSIKNESKSESGVMMDLYILKAMTMKGIKIECKKCKRKKKLTIQHKKYYTHTIDDLELLCWQCHTKEDCGTAKKTPKQWQAIKIKKENKKTFVCLRGMKFEISSCDEVVASHEPKAQVSE